MNTLQKILLTFTLVLSTAFTNLGYASDSAKGIVLVAGATGGTGRIIVSQLQEQGFHVRAMVRNLEKGKTVLGEDIELVKADVTDPATLTNAVAGANYIISAIGTPIGTEGKNNPETVDYLGVVALIDAAKQAGTEKFILITSGGTTWWIHPLNWFGGDVLKWKHKSEVYLRESGLTHVIIRPAGGLKDEPANTKTIKFTQSDGIPSTISRSDVATAAVNALIFSEANNKTFEIQDDEEGQRSDQVDWLNTFSSMTVDSDNF